MMIQTEALSLIYEITTLVHISSNIKQGTDNLHYASFVKMLCFSISIFINRFNCYG